MNIAGGFVHYPLSGWNAPKILYLGGYTLDLAGAVLLYRFSNPRGSDQESQISLVGEVVFVWGSGKGDEAQNRAMDRMQQKIKFAHRVSRIGFGLIATGSVLQMAAAYLS